MNTLKTLSKFFLVLTLCLTTASCSSDDDDNTIDSDSSVDLSKAYLRLFGFAETYTLEVKTNHPKLLNNEEVERGQMRIKVPQAYAELRLTTKASDFNNNEFTIRPELGRLEDFSNGKITYTITSKIDNTKKIHYDVFVTTNDIQ